MFLWRQFWNSNLSSSAKSGHHNRSQRVILLVLLERKALIRPLMIKKFFVNWSFVIGCLTVGSKKTLANYHVKCHGRFLCSFTYPWIFHVGNLPLESPVTHTNTIFCGKGSFTTVKVSRVTSPIESCEACEARTWTWSKTCEHGLTCHCFQFLSGLWRSVLFPTTFQVSRVFSDASHVCLTWFTSSHIVHPPSKEQEYLWFVILLQWNEHGDPAFYWCFHGLGYTKNIF